jgi:hypothetical protein
MGRMAEKVSRARGCSAVRRTAINYVLELTRQGFCNELPLEDAKDLFSQIADRWDRLTIKAYFGTVPHRSVKRFRRIAQYQSGCVSQKTIELAHQVSGCKGYLEKMGLASFSLRGSSWFMKIESGVLVPQLRKPQKTKPPSMQNLSLSPLEANDASKIGCADELTRCTVSVNTGEQTKNNNLQDERYKLCNTRDERQAKRKELSQIDVAHSNLLDCITQILGG